MAKKVKFPLDMGNEAYVRTLEELKENYNSEKVTEYFLEGRLLIWLNDRYYEEEAAAVGKLAESGDKKSLAAKLGKIFGIEIQEDVDVENLEVRREKLEKLREITSDDEILDNVDSVAFSQEELGDLLDDEVNVIYLCGKSFRIPMSVKNVRYVGVNNPVVTISGKGEINFEANGIIIERCELPQGIKENISLSQKSSEYKIKFYVPKQTPAVKSNNVVLAAEYDNDVLYIYFRNDSKAFKSVCFGSDYQIWLSRKKSGERSRTPYRANIYSNEYFKELLSKTDVYAKGDSAFEIYKIQMLEALDNLPKHFKKKDGIVDITDSETVAAVEEAVKLFIEYNDLKAEKAIQYLEDEEEPYY